MIVDSSAVVAVVTTEPDFRAYLAALLRADRVRMSAATFLETSIVLDRHRDPVMGRRLDRLLTTVAAVIEPVTEEQARIARAAHRDFGRGSGHPARLNFGDCFAYALATERGEPLLYKGDDFGHTDVRSALAEDSRQH